MKFYRKQPIEAEQFDNSREMAEKYHVEYDGASSILPFRIDTPKGWLGIKVGDWIVNHSDVFARAWLDGYVVEEDK